MSSDRTQLIDQGTMVYPLNPELAQSAEACPHCRNSIAVGEQFCMRCGYQRGTWKLRPASAAATGVSSTAPSGPAGPALFTLRGADGLEFPLPAGEWVLGRGEVDLRVDDGYISRSHAKLAVSEAGVTVTDLGSANGSFYSGNRMNANEPLELVEGSSIRFGNHEFSIAAASDSAGAEEATGQDASATAVIPTAETALPDLSTDLLAAQLSSWALIAESGETIDLPLGELTMGRKAEKAKFLVNDGFVSGLHCVLQVSEDSLTLTDVGSTNGTFIDDVRLEANVPVELFDGGRFRMGQTVFMVQSTAVPDEEAPEQPSEADPAPENA